jgi:hypothetical protein
MKCIEYEKLKDEIIKRIELRQQILVLTFTIMGILFTIALDNEKAEIALIYPPIAALMAMLWIQNDSGIRNAAFYIFNNYESKASLPRYEHYKMGLRSKGGLSSIFLFASHGGVFLFSQLLTVYLVLYYGKSQVDLKPWLNASYFCIFIVCVLFIWWWQSGKSLRSPQ